VLRALSGLKRKMFCTMLIVGLLVPALPIAAFAIPGDGELSIAENLAADEGGRFTTLLAAATAAGLADELDDCEGFGPVTLFAPTNTAFSALADALGVEVADLLTLPNLADILLYHLLPGVVESGDLPAPGNSTSVETLNGEDILIEVIAGDPNQVRINGVAFVIETDYDACNGIIHVIDAVLVPEAEEECQTIAEIAAADGRFTTLLAAAGIAGLDDELADPEFGPVTLFAPTDTAFAALKAALGEDAWNALLADPATLGNVLLFHMLEGKVYSSDLPAPGNSIVAPTLLGQDLLIEVTTDGVLINGVAMVIQTDIDACNGVIHVIDAVLVPELAAPTTPTTPTTPTPPTAVPVLPATGIGPEGSLPWQALVLVALSLGLAYTAMRKYAIARD
jgi:transforming growth factor-beta-induced protein